jgi:hypothetical protein
VHLDELVAKPKAQPCLKVIIVVQVLLSVFGTLLAVKGRLPDAVGSEEEAFESLF